MSRNSKKFFKFSTREPCTKSGGGFIEKFFLRFVVDAWHVEILVAIKLSALHFFRFRLFILLIFAMLVKQRDVSFIILRIGKL